MLTAKNVRRSSRRSETPVNESNLNKKIKLESITEVPKTPTIRKSPRSAIKKQVESEIVSKPVSVPSSPINKKMPATPTRSRDLTVEDPFNVAKRAFHRSGAFKIVGRVEEKAELSSFWYDHVSANKGASIYISGNPGTGKTALVDELLPELLDPSTMKLIKINCMMLKDPLKAFHEIVQATNHKSLQITDKNPFMIIDALEKFFCKEARVMYVIVIDEVDQIGMKDPELLCRLLAMPYLSEAKVSIFGIANSMDLTERFLPRLKLLNCEPAVLHFPQYTVPDITSILSDRLERINKEADALGRCFIDKSAIELTARKVATTGDLRRALDILRQAIDLAEDEYKLSPNTTGALVKLPHVLKIMEKFGNSQSGPLVLLKSLNLHQKVILAAIVGFPLQQQQQQPQQVLTIQKLYEEYCNGAARPPKLYDPVTRSEFIDLISNLESMSLIGKSTESSSASSASTSSSNTDLWKLKVYLLVPNELVKAMISQELPTIKVLFGL